jgi:hypothetical protein
VILLKFGVLLAFLVVLDCVTTYFASYKYPLEYEFNMFIRGLMKLQRELVFVYAIFEYLVLMCYCKVILPLLKEKFNIKNIKFEYLIIAVLVFVIANNIASLIV